MEDADFSACAKSSVVMVFKTETQLVRSNLWLGRETGIVILIPRKSCN